MLNALSNLVIGAGSDGVPIRLYSFEGVKGKRSFYGAALFYILRIYMPAILHGCPQK